MRAGTRIGVIRMYDSIAILKAYGEPTYDEYLNEVESIIETEVYVQPRGVYNSEFYNAAQIGLKPSVTLFIPNLEDYHGETVLSFEGRDYDVIRTDWNAQRDGVSLVCQERVENE